jgi:hypothetical protein
LFAISGLSVASSPMYVFSLSRRCFSARLRISRLELQQKHNFINLFYSILLVILIITTYTSIYNLIEYIQSGEVHNYLHFNTYNREKENCTYEGKIFLFYLNLNLMTIYCMKTININIIIRKSLYNHVI